ncbi:aminopeptidase [Clostridia bacterium]|nr:aminopeptidase [Clostridia bacterium]
MFDTLKTQKQLASIFAPSGRESELINKLSELSKPFSDDQRTDAMGNLILLKKGSGAKKLMLSAHADSIGIVVTHIDEKGFLRFCPVGGVHVKDVLHRTIRFSNGVLGAVGVDGKVKPNDLKLSDAFIDIGASDEKSARKFVNVGDFGVYHAETYTTGSNIVSPCLDDRIGCVVLLQVLSMLQHPKNDVYFVFSAQEEVGCRGAKTAAYDIAPDIGIAVDICYAGDVPEAEPLSATKLGGGAAIKYRDASLLGHPKVIKLLEDIAKKANIPFQRDVMSFGGTDAGAISISRGGVASCAVSIPTRYGHSPVETAALSDIEACSRLLLAVCNA